MFPPLEGAGHHGLPVGEATGGHHVPHCLPEHFHRSCHDNTQGERARAGSFIFFFFLPYLSLSLSFSLTMSLSLSHSLTLSFFLSLFAVVVAE